jgi:membrane protein DedA with SNARE-associated domain
VSDRAPGERPPKPPWWQWNDRVGRLYWIGVVLLALAAAGNAWRFVAESHKLALAVAVAFGAQAAWMTVSGVLVRRRARGNARDA